MFKLLGSISDYDKEQFELCITALWDDYKITKAEDSETSRISSLLQGCTLLKGWHAVTIAQVCILAQEKKKAEYVVVVMDTAVGRVGHRGMTHTEHVSEAYQLFLVGLDSDLGHIVIRPETISDKIGELFGNVDIDFKDHPRFSTKYFALSETPEDESKFRKHVKGRMLDVIAEYSDLRIEIMNKTMIVCTSKRINPSDAVNLANFVFKVNG